jgi:hypothetical protein
MTDEQLRNRVEQVVIAAKEADEKNACIEPQWLINMLTIAPA